MIKVSVLYPHAVGAKFDFDYYIEVHMPMSLRLLGDAVRSCSVERGVEGTEVTSSAIRARPSRLHFSPTQRCCRVICPSTRISRRPFSSVRSRSLDRRTP
jgi:uncharacterized protein (TIGR02118 family)